MNDLGEKDKSDLTNFFQAVQKNSNTKGFEQYDPFQKLKNRSINNDQIINYMKTYIFDLMGQNKELQKGNHQLGKSEMNTLGKPIVFEKKCQECQKESFFIYFPCEIPNNNDLCIFCRKEELKTLIQNSNSSHECSICNKAPHETELKAMSFFLENFGSKEKNIQIVEEEKIKNFKANIPSDSNEVQNFKNDNENSNMFSKTIPRKRAGDGESSNNYPNKKKTNETFEMKQNSCVFCGKEGELGKDIFANDNCAASNSGYQEGQGHLYHNDCLLAKGKEVLNSKGKLADIACPKCGSTFDYSTISNIDKHLADCLTDNTSPVQIFQPPIKVDPKSVEYDACMFCKENNQKKLIKQENCQRNGHLHLYHNECLLKFGREKANEGKKISDILCPYCRAEFDHCTFTDLDQDLADELNPYKASKKVLKKEDVILI